MKLVDFTSGLKVCGIRDYDRHLTEALAGTMSIETVRYPTKRVTRDQPRKLLALRREYRALAARADSADAALIHWVTRFWNGSRPVENMFPVFQRRVRRPAVLVLHEWPTIPETHVYSGSRVAKIVKRALTRSWLARDIGRIDYGQWLDGLLFQSLDHVVMHTPELRDRLVAAGYPTDRISVYRFPVHALPQPAWTPDEVRARFGLGGKRVLFLLGNPARRKGFDLAVEALKGLPEDVVILLVCPQGNADVREALDAITALAERLGVKDRFIVSDYLDDAQLAAVYSVVDVALSPFRSVTGSSSLANFIAGGAPVVASNLPAIRDIAEHGAGIELCEPDSAESLRAAVERVLASPSHLATLRDRTHAYARATSFSVLADNIRAILEGVVARR